MLRTSIRGLSVMAPCACGILSSDSQRRFCTIVRLAAVPAYLELGGAQHVASEGGHFRPRSKKRSPDIVVSYSSSFYVLSHM